MNERIKELAEQAWDSLIDESQQLIKENGQVNWDFVHAYDNRFAELIVRECAGLNFRELGLSGSSSFDVGRMIKQHFGVEE